MRQHKRDYYRWTGGEHIGALKLDKWKPEGRRGKLSTKDYIEQKVDEFVQSPDVKNKMRECAAALVNHRRARLAYNWSRWKRNTYCCKFRCLCGEDFDSPSPLRKHLHNEHHSTDFTNLYKFIDEDSHPEFPGGPYQPSSLATCSWPSTTNFLLLDPSQGYLYHYQKSRRTPQFRLSSTSTKT